ncbi:hypothetical protein [Streptomyces chrestomyceticus]|uniref:hypothetical protein n=1 Tax=Streptomyces chrestomyceticus TaxID=68185 RepID=UPI0037A21E1B
MVNTSERSERPDSRGARFRAEPGGPGRLAAAGEEMEAAVRRHRAGRIRTVAPAADRPAT